MTAQNLVLALDTASDALAVAIGRKVKDCTGSIELLASADAFARREANVRLVPAIEELFSVKGLSKDEIACIVCGRGPGSFTGVRIALATAKGLAAGLQVPLFGVATSDALAWQAWSSGFRGHLAVLMDAMRGEVYPARYMLDNKRARRQDPLTVVKAEELAEKWQGHSQNLRLTGDALYKYEELFTHFEKLDENHWRPKGCGLLKAFECLPKDEGNAVTLLPVYTRLSDAEENERKRLASGGELVQGALAKVPVSGVAGQACSKQRGYRPAATADIASMVALEQGVYAHGQSVLDGECWTARLYQEALGKLDQSWWVCYQNNEFAGFIGGHLIDGQMHILDVVVAKHLRRQGIARQLLWRLVQDAKTLGATKLTLEVRASNAAAQALYDELKLTKTGRRKAYYAPLNKGGKREDALIMTGNIDEVYTKLGSSTSLALSGADKTQQSLRFSAFEDSGARPSLSGETTSKHPRILAIESSCDETAVALIDGEGQLLSNIVASQTDFHARFGGVVPEIASRKHTEALYPAVMEAMAGYCWKDLDAIAVTYAPGLIGALVVGMAFAKGLCWALDLPLIKVNHLEGHIYANRFVRDPNKTESDTSLGYRMSSKELVPPFVIALLSGGNTMLVHVLKWGEYHVLGETLDDAVGEAYDKVAKALGLGYPGGPIIARLAQEGDPEALDFPRALLHSHNYQFSLSGLKTAVLTSIREQTLAGSLHIPDVAASFEQAVIEVQVAKAVRACKECDVKIFCIGGGVAANHALRKAYQEAMEPQGIRVVFPPQLACTDNAAMIAAVALDRYRLRKFAHLSDDAAANAKLELAY